MLALFSKTGVATALSLRAISTAGLLALGGALLHGRRQSRHLAAVRQGERCLRKELLAYLLFNVSPRSMPAAELGRHLSRLIAVRSSFPRAALMLRDASGVLVVTGSAGFDDLGVEALNRWGAQVSAHGTTAADLLAAHERVGTASFTLPLERRAVPQRNPLSHMLCGKVHVVPLRTAEGLLGMLVVCADHLRAGTKVTETIHLTRFSPDSTVLPLADLLEPLEALALRLTLQLAAPENIAGVSPAPRLPHRSDRHSRSTARTHDRRPAAALTEGDERRSLDTSAAPIRLVETAVALEQIRQIIAPATHPPQRVAGVSGRPPRSIWRPGGPLAV